MSDVDLKYLAMLSVGLKIWMSIVGSNISLESTFKFSIRHSTFPNISGRHPTFWPLFMGPNSFTGPLMPRIYKMQIHVLSSCVVNIHQTLTGRALRCDFWCILHQYPWKYSESPKVGIPSGQFLIAGAWCWRWLLNRHHCCLVSIQVRNTQIPQFFSGC